MSVLPAAIREASAPREYPLSVAAYHAMIADGTLDENDPVELIEGELLFKMSKNREHRRATMLNRQWLDRVLPSGWLAQVQDPITLATSEPEPDICCVTRESSENADPHPGAADVGLVIEVSDTSLAYDRVRKLRMYAGAGIIEYWIVNLVDRQIEVYTQADTTGPEPRYLSRVDRKPGEPIALPASLGGATIDVAALLPPA